MLLTTLVLSGVILAASTVAGLLMLYQIRQAGNAAQSASALAAADAGIEYELYKFMTQDCSVAAPVFKNGATVKTEALINDSGELIINSDGRGGKTFRSFRLNLGLYTDPLPCLP